MKLKAYDVKPGDFFRRETDRGGCQAEAILSRDERFVVVKTDCGNAFMEPDEEVETLTEEEILRHTFDPSDKQRLDWLTGKVRDGEIRMHAKDAPMAWNLRNLIDIMMIREGEHRRKP